jgi:heme/copper-type cytochrome/quinol oxidase subunit 4
MAAMPYSEDIRANVEFLEQRARDEARQEIDRAQTLDQKAAGLIATSIVLTAAAVALSGRLQELHAGAGARTFWAVLVVLTLVLLLTSLGFATGSVRPQAYRTVLDLKEFDRWPTRGFLVQDRTFVRGEQMRGSIAAVHGARSKNKKKGDRLAAAFGFFAAAIVSIVVLGSAVTIRLAESHAHHAHRGLPATGREPARAHSGPGRTAVP